MKQKRPKKVILVPIVADNVCHNQRCRQRLIGRHKIIDMPNGYSAPICIRCYMLIGKVGFEYNGDTYNASGAMSGRLS